MLLIIMLLVKSLMRMLVFEMHAQYISNDCHGFVDCNYNRKAYHTVSWGSWRQLLKVDLVLYIVQHIISGEQLCTRNWSLRSSKRNQSSSSSHICMCSK